jgi:hypothetical protein
VDRNESAVARVLDRAQGVREAFGWLIGSWIVLRAIAAVDGRRRVVGAGFLLLLVSALLRFWPPVSP